MLDGWLDAIGGALPIVDGRDGYFAVAMAEAVELSIATGEQISLAEVRVGVTYPVAALEIARAELAPSAARRQPTPTREA